MEPRLPGRPPSILKPGYTFASITDKISSIVLVRGTSYGWLVGFGLSFCLVMVLLMTITHLVLTGVGIWGVNVPVGWGFDIINFVWWIGIGHAGTLISAILLLLNQSWRTSINRFAEAMTLFAVACAGMYPLFHTGRPWLAYWLLPFPIPWEFGRSFEVRWCGTYSPFPRTPPCRRCSGSSASSPTLPLCAIAPRTLG